MKEMEQLKLLIDERNSLDPTSEEYAVLTEEIQLLQNDLVTLEIMGEDV
jgi:hypothetical protein